MTAPSHPVRRLAKALGGKGLVDLWRTSGALLGRRRRRLLAAPALGGVLALLETCTLLSIVRLLLMLVEGDRTTSIATAGIDVDLTFSELAAFAAAAIALTAGTRYVEATVLAKTTALAVESARQSVIATWFSTDWEQIRSSRHGRLQQLIGVNAQQAIAPISLVAMGSTTLVSLVVYLVIMVLTAPVVALTLLVLALLTAAVLTPLRRRVKAAAGRYSDGLREIQLSATSNAALGRELQLFGVTAAVTDELERDNLALAADYERLRFLQRFTPSLFQQAMLAAVVGLVVAGRGLDVSAGGFGTAAILGVRSLSYIQQLNTLTQQYIESQPLLDELASSLRADPARGRRWGDQVLGRIRSLELRDVSYQYEPGVIALHSVDLVVQAGERVGIIGPSGGGKSTLCNLLAGLLTPTTGTYLVDGADMTTYARTSWADQLGILSQEPTLLRASVFDNIAFHRPATPEEVRRAVERAAAVDVVEHLPDGMATLVGEGHSSLSGGQRQRVALARTLLREPSCIVLDEPTSALDARSEGLIKEALAALPADTTLVVVSHRPQLLELCSRIVTVIDGRVVSDVGRGGADLGRWVGEDMEGEPDPG